MMGDYEEYNRKLKALRRASFGQVRLSVTTSTLLVWGQALAEEVDRPRQRTPASVSSKLAFLRDVRREYVQTIKRAWPTTNVDTRRQIRPVLRWLFTVLASMEHQLTLREIEEML